MAFFAYGYFKSLYEILESPPSLVPDSLPVHIEDRVNAMKQMAAGHARKMPAIHCLLHPDYLLRQHRGRWLGRPRGKMRRWWAYCPSEGKLGKLAEIYIVRIDGFVQRMPKRKRAKLAGGRSPKAESKKQNVRIGGEVERVRRDRFEGFIEVRRSLPKKTRARKGLLRSELATAGFSKEEIEAGLSARTAKIAARNFVTAAHNLQFSTVAQYHREYLKLKQGDVAQNS